MDDVLVVYDEAMLAHHPSGWDPDHPEWTEAVQALLAEQYPDKDLTGYAHPERPERLRVVVDALRNRPIHGTRWVTAEPAELSALGRVHTRAHVDFIESLAGRACWLDIDTTAVSPGSVAAARLAAGAGVVAVEAIAGGHARRALCTVRPPGHHALSGRAMGFCLYNNAAVAAAHARHLGMERVLIWDWDLHHGNGTQEIFYGDPDVLFIDTHCAAPFYPGTGSLEEIGAGRGEGYTLNVPLPAGSGNGTLLEAARRIVQPAAVAFRPDMIVVSAGFDPHHLDKTFAMDEAGFAALAQVTCELADAICGGRVIVVLEGGYNAEALSASAHAVVRVLAGDGADAASVQEDDPGIVAVGEAAAFHADHLAALTRRSPVPPGA